MQSITDAGTLFQLEISQWSGRAKLSREEIPNADNLPPEALASLGSKKLLDPAKLKPFGMLRTRTSRVMERYGIHLLGGYYVRNDLVPQLDTELAVLENEWLKAVNAFVSDFDTDVDAWCAQYPEWEHSIRAALPTAANVKNRFLFKWHAFKITPAEDAQSAVKNTEHELSKVGDTALDEVAKLAASTFDTTFKDRESKANGKTFNCLDALYDKVSCAAFTKSELRSLARCIGMVRDEVREMVKEGKADICVEPVSNLLIAISTADGIRRKMEILNEDSTDDEVFCTVRSILDPQPAPALPNPPDEVIVDDILVNLPADVVDKVDSLVQEADAMLGKEFTPVQPVQPVQQSDNLAALLDDEDLW